MIHKKTTINQTSAFLNAAAAFVGKRNPYKSTGARVLAHVEPLIRRGVKMGLTDLQIVLSLNSIPKSPTVWLKRSTAKQYVQAARLEFGMRKNVPFLG